MKPALITIATVGILAPTAWVVGANAQYGAPAPAYALPQPTPLHQPIALLAGMPVEPTVALLVRTMALPLRSIAVVAAPCNVPVRQHV
jgi:hypothetical protein